MSRKVATVFGGSGFVGRYIVKRLASEGWVVRVAGRDPEKSAFLKPAGDVGQIVPIYADILSEASVAAAVQDAALVINLVGILYERGKASFRAIHAEGPGRVARLSKEAGVERLLHMSALGASKQSNSDYARSKAEGEEAVLAAFPEATIFRPSIIFGAEDNFFNQFAQMSSFSPFLPVITGRGQGVDGPKFQPVYVGDVADAFMAALHDENSKGKTYEFGGPRQYSMAELMKMVLRLTGRRRLILRIPAGLAKIQASILQYAPKPLLTPDQVRLLGQDNVLSGKMPGLQDLGIEPSAPEAIVPTYLERFQDASKRALARMRERQPR